MFPILHFVWQEMQKVKEKNAGKKENAQYLEDLLECLLPLPLVWLSPG